MKKNYSSNEKSQPEVESQKDSDNAFYPHASSNRNICFTLKDGKKVFLSYSYLISCEFVPEEQKIVMQFTTHSVELHGEKLEGLFEGLFYNSVMNVIEQDERYGEKEKSDITFIKEIKFKVIY
ncbi:MAG: hypothetical protein IPJ79_18690 [Bacteroidetes bacterium]|nr:hypothetical protein [Bacteroidota bacterium]